MDDWGSVGSVALDVEDKQSIIVPGTKGTAKFTAPLPQ